MTDAELQEIRLAAAAVDVYRDEFGGEFVRQKDSLIFGQRAIMHRKHLLAYVDELEEKLGIKRDPIQAQNYTHERRVVHCSSCMARIIWFKTAAGKNMPVDADSVKPGEFTLDVKKHKSHFATCPQRDQHRKKRASSVTTK